MRGTNKHEKIKRTPANAILDKWERHYDKMIAHSNARSDVTFAHFELIFVTFSNL